MSTAEGMPAILDTWGAEIEIARQLSSDAFSSYELRMPKATLARVLWACLEWHDDRLLNDSERADFASDRAAVESILSSLDAEEAVA